jgi:hypothetical protein
MSRKLLYIIAGLAMAGATLGSASVANAGSAAGGSFSDGPYASHSPDSGTCGNNWAVDLMNRSFKVTLPANNDGSYTVVETFSAGHFLTHAGTSPESCGTTPTNGHIKAGVSGTFGGSFTIIVAPGATFNPNGSCTLDSEGECTTNTWIVGFFGSGAGGAGHNVTKFNLKYVASAKVATVANKWTNADTGDIGDIASS